MLGVCSGSGTRVRSVRVRRVELPVSLGEFHIADRVGLDTCEFLVGQSASYFGRDPGHEGTRRNHCTFSDHCASGYQ